MPNILCERCLTVIGSSSVERRTGQVCGTCALIPLPEVAKPPTFAERISALESDVVKVTTVMVGKGDLLAKDVAVAIEAGAVEELLEP